MARMREQNEKIKQRRLDVQADEDAFRQTQQVERAKMAQNRKVQENVDRTREQNAKRKMDKIQSREWDSGKPASNWKRPVVQTALPTESAASVDIKSIVPAADTSSVTTAAPTPTSPDRGNSNWSRGSSPRRGRGRGRGASASQRDSSDKSTPVDATTSVLGPNATPSVDSPAEMALQRDSVVKTGAAAS
ncbi:hypothetical protein BDQ17DRAFT_1357935 [Cyathus striatus]|nr:hypothetical protein BDQ17DRAFT_1357935 [Cyathus striatus]